MKVRWLFGILAVVCVSLLYSDEARANAALSCKCLSYVSPLTDDWVHRFNSAGDRPYKCDDAAEGPCHEDPQEGLCSEWHNGCGPSLVGLKVDELSESEMKVLAASSGARYNSDRAALQIAGCSGTLVASIPMSEAEYAVAKAGSIAGL